MLVLNFEKIHCSYHALHGHEDILKDQFDESSFIVVRVAGPVDDPHLFDERGLARLTRAWKRQVKNQIDIFLNHFLIVKKMTLDCSNRNMYRE